jgi:ribosomal protein S18 acetylase RimI-like enzyme
MILIREAKKKDLNQLILLSKELHQFDNKYQSKKLNKYTIPKKDCDNQLKKYLLKTIISKDAILFIAEKDNSIIGYIQGSIINNNNPFMFSKKIGDFENLIVTKKYHKKGISNLLYDKLMDWFEIKNCEIIELEVLTNNPAKKIYQKWGFISISEKMRKSFTK